MFFVRDTYLLLWEEKNLELRKKNVNLIKNGECVITGNVLMKREKRLERGITETNKIKGIYLIINKQNCKFYIGSSMSIYSRWNTHVRKLKENKHFNKHLQNVWNKYGPENFYLSVDRKPKCL